MNDPKLYIFISLTTFHCKNLKLEKFGESRTRLGELQGFVYALNLHFVVVDHHVQYITEMSGHSFKINNFPYTYRSVRYILIWFDVIIRSLPEPVLIALMTTHEKFEFIFHFVVSDHDRVLKDHRGHDCMRVRFTTTCANPEKTTNLA
jgi:hypothetical protein